MSNLQSTLSFSTTTIIQENYDVFLNFRGEDTRNCFTCHLYEALHKKVKTFIDDGLEKGDRIWPTLKGVIEQSKISVVIFSNDYASSKWCLRELVEIMECQNSRNQIVIPVFYRVDPSNVRKQTGSFEHSFDKHGNESQEEVQEWRKALYDASNLCGWDSSVTRPDTILIDKIVKDIRKKLMGECTSHDYGNEVKKLEQTCLRLTKGYQTFESRMSILKDIIDALSDSDVNMVGIYGMGGVGKTTLAKEVAREAGQKNGLSLFDKIIFVEVSQSPNIEEIQREVAFNLGLPLFPKEMPLSGRANILCDRLKKEEKILLILDNIWGRINFEKIGIPIENDRRGLKLLLTTRNRYVLTNQMDCRCNFEVGALNKADAWSLFTSITGTFIEHPYLNSIACEVSDECGGMPIAIVAIAEALKGQGQNEWRNALRELKNPSSKSFGGIAKEVYTSIKLSYDYLENEELKETFLLCSRMGRTYDASVQDLFKYGLGLGLFENFNTLEEALCNVYVSVNKLKAASLLLDAPESEFFINPPTSETFAMHDITCDVAKSIANVFTSTDIAIPQFWTNENTLINCTSITLYNVDELPDDLELVCPQLKLLYVKLKDSSLRIPDNFFAHMSRLQVLHLVEMDCRELPTSFSFLVNLQALCLDQCKLGDTTVIGKLKKLEVLSFRESNIEKLPKEMRHLTRLRLLDLTDCYDLRVIPPGVMSNLTKLEALYTVNTSILWGVKTPCIRGSNVSIDELKHLGNLTLLEMHILDAKMSKGLLSPKLERYKIIIGDRWDYLSKTCRTLKFSIDTTKDGIISQLKGIEELELGQVLGAKNVLDALDSSCFPTVKHLKVESSSHCSCIVESCDALTSLQSLILRYLDNMEKICNSPLGANSFLQLRTIRVENCPKLNNIFSFSTVTALLQLEEIMVFNCENMEEIFAIGGQDDSNNTEVVNEIKFSQLCSVFLSGLPRLKSFCCKVKTASALQLTSNTQPREIISGDEIDVLTLFFNDKVAIPNLQSLDIYKIPVEKIWHNIPPKISSCVQNLTWLRVSGCCNLKELFSSSTVITEQSREEEMRDTISFPKLDYLVIEDLEKLTTLWSGYYIEFPTLKEFIIEKCPQFDAFIFDDKVRVPSLEKMGISDMDNLKVIWHNQLDGDSIPKLKSLNVTRCKNLLKVFPLNIRGGLLSLESLTVSECGSLEEILDLPGIISEERNLKMIWHNQLDGDSFPKFKSLEVNRCQKLLTLFPLNIRGWFLSLESLSVWGCGSLEEIFDLRGIISEERNSIATRELCFSNLQKLLVMDCQILKYLFAASNNVANDEYSPKFLFPKLTSLVLYDLPELRSFYSGRHTVEGPVLKILELSGQMQMQQPFFFVEQAFPCLEDLTLRGKDIMMMWLGQVPESSFLKLKILKVFYDDSTCLPLCIIQRFQNWKELLLAHSSYKEIFSNGDDQTQAPTPARIKTLHLYGLKDLKYMWKPDFKLDLILQNLEVLIICYCLSLINVMPPSASFQNLTVMKVDGCCRVINIGTSTAAKSLVQLTQMNISNCLEITEVVGNHGDVTEDEIIFPKLKRLQLLNLPSLTSFCYWNVTLQFPLLEEVIVDNCPKMKIFSRGVLTTQMLREIKIDKEPIELRLDIDINKAIQQFHEKVNVKNMRRIQEDNKLKKANDVEQVTDVYMMMREHPQFKGNYPFLAKFLRLCPEKAIFAILGKFRFSHNFCFPSLNRLPSILACLGFLAVFISAIISILLFLVIFSN